MKRKGERYLKYYSTKLNGLLSITDSITNGVTKDHVILAPYFIDDESEVQRRLLTCVRFLG